VTGVRLERCRSKLLRLEFVGRKCPTRLGVLCPRHEIAGVPCSPPVRPTGPESVEQTIVKCHSCCCYRHHWHQQPRSYCPSSARRIAAFRARRGRRRVVGRRGEGHRRSRYRCRNRWRRCRSNRTRSLRTYGSAQSLVAGCDLPLAAVAHSGGGQTLTDGALDVSRGVACGVVIYPVSVLLIDYSAFNRLYLQCRSSPSECAINRLQCF
jgi:hypothetical protein